MGKMLSPILFLFLSDLLILFGNEDIHKSLNEFDVWPDPTTESADLERQKKNDDCIVVLSVAIDWILFKLTVRIFTICNLLRS